MRKILTTSMVVGAALLVAACGGDKAANNAADLNAANDVMVDDSMNMGDANLMEGNTAGGDANMMNDMDSSTTADNTVATNNM